MILGREFKLRNAQTAVPLAATRMATIREAGIRAVRVAILEVAIRVAGILAGADGEAIHPTEASRIPIKTLKTTPRYSRYFTPRGY